MYLVTWLNCWYIQVIPIHGDWINTFSHFVTIDLTDLVWVVYKSGNWTMTIGRRGGSSAGQHFIIGLIDLPVMFRPYDKPFYGLLSRRRAVSRNTICWRIDGKGGKHVCRAYAIIASLFASVYVLFAALVGRVIGRSILEQTLYPLSMMAMCFPFQIRIYVERKNNKDCIWS